MTQTTNVISEIDRVLNSSFGRECVKRSRMNPWNRHTYEMLDEIEFQRVERIRLSQRAWWKKLLGVMQ